MGAVGPPTHAEPRPTPNILRIRYNALDVLYVWTRAVDGLMHAHEGVLAEVFRAGNCCKHNRGLDQWKMVANVDSGTYCYLRASPIAGCLMAVVVVAVVDAQTFR
jgi:hypothetical protein